MVYCDLCHGEVREFLIGGAGHKCAEIGCCVCGGGGASLLPSNFYFSI